MTKTSNDAMEGSSRRTLNVVTFFLALMECLLFCGIIFGWFSIREVLEKEHYFGAGVPDKETTQPPKNDSLPLGNNSSSPSQQESGAVCEQESSKDVFTFDSGDSEAMFNLVFTMASSAVNYSSLFTGFLLDKFGTLVSKMLASLMFSSGIFLMAFSTPETSWIIFISFSFLIPVGGYWHFISNFQIGNLFGEWQGTVVTIFSGAFDSSAFVFLLFAEIYARGYLLPNIFLFYGCTSIFLLLNAIFLLPRGAIPFPLPADWSPRGEANKEIQKEIEASKATQQCEKHCCEKEKPNNEEPTDVQFKSSPSKSSQWEEPRFWRDCVFTWKFSLHVVFVAVNQLKIYIFLSSVFTFLSTFDMPPSEFDLMKKTLGVLQLSGIVWSPIVGLIVDRNKRSAAGGDSLGDFALPLLITCVLGTICSANMLNPYPVSQFASFLLQVILRAFNYGLAFSFIACNFPPQHIGKLIGLLMAIAATFSLLQYPLIQSLDSCDPDFTYLHTFLLILGVLPFAHPLAVFLQARKLRSQKTPKLNDDFVLEEDDACARSKQSNA